MSHPPPYSYSRLNDDDTNDEGMELPQLPQPTVPVMSRPYEPPIMPYPTCTVGPPKLSWEFVPHDFLLPTILIMIILAILNVTTIVFTVPALICSVLAHEKKQHGVSSYIGAKKLGMGALVLDIIALTYYFITALIIIGSIVGSYFHHYYCYNCYHCYNCSY